MADVQGRGWISEVAAGDLLVALGFGSLSDQERMALVKAMDPGATGRIDKSEFEQAIQRRLAAPDSPEELAQMLRVLDPADAGTTSTDMKKAFEAQGADLDQAALERLINGVADGNPVMNGEHWRQVTTKQSSSSRLSTKC